MDIQEHVIAKHAVSCTGLVRLVNGRTTAQPRFKVMRREVGQASAEQPQVLCFG